MKKLSLLCLLFSIVLGQAQTTSINSLVNTPNTILVDVRTPSENIGLIPPGKNIVVFCRSGKRAEKAKALLQANKYIKVYNGGAWHYIKSLQKMNILDQMQFSTEKPSVVIIKKNDTIKYFAVGLAQNTVMKKHKTAVPATLVVAKGEIDFHIQGEVIRLKTYDTYEIPVDIEHEVVGVANENIFLVTQELK